jgi:hypothetical protein
MLRGGNRSDGIRFSPSSLMDKLDACRLKGRDHFRDSRRTGIKATLSTVLMCGTSRSTSSITSMEGHNAAVEPWRVTLVDTGEKTMIGGRIKRILPYLGDDKEFCLTLLFIVGGHLLDLRLDLRDLLLDVLLLAAAVDDRGVLLSQSAPVGFSEHLERHVLERDTEAFGDHRAKATRASRAVAPPCTSQAVGPRDTRVRLTQR